MNHTVLILTHLTIIVQLLRSSRSSPLLSHLLNIKHRSLKLGQLDLLASVNAGRYLRGDPFGRVVAQHGLVTAGRPRPHNLLLLLRRHLLIQISSVMTDGLGVAGLDKAAWCVRPACSCCCAAGGG